MKKTNLLLIALLSVFSVSAQWNAIGWNPFTIRSTEGDSTFLLSAPSREDLQKGTASWVSTNSVAPYKVYTALLTQSGTDAPVATVLENTLGGTVVWIRSEAGAYTATIPFDASGMHVVVNNMHSTGSLVPISTDPGGNGIEGYFYTSFSYPITIVVGFFNNSLTRIDISDVGASFYINLIVYP